MALVVAGRGDEEPARPAAPAAPPAADPLAYPHQGLRMARPVSWTAELRDGVIRLRSGDGRTGVAVVVAARRVGAARMQRDLIAALDGARVTGRTASRLGDLPARSAALAVRPAGGRAGQALVLSARSRWRTYGVTVVGAGTRPLSTSPDVAAILNSFEFAAPG